MTSSDVNVTSDTFVPQLPPHSHDHSYQLTFEQMIEEHKVCFLFCYKQHKLLNNGQIKLIIYINLLCPTFKFIRT